LHIVTIDAFQRFVAVRHDELHATGKAARSAGSRNPDAARSWRNEDRLMAARAERDQARAETVSHVQRAATQQAVPLIRGGNRGRTAGRQPLASPADGRGGSSWEHAFPGTADRVGILRAAVRRLLGDCPVADDVARLMSELAANAVRHSRSGEEGGTFTARLVDIPGEYVLGGIEDGGSDWAGDLRDSARHASGLHILLALSSDCGTYGGRRKRTVWFLVQYPAFDHAPAAHASAPAMPTRMPSAQGPPLSVLRRYPDVPGWPAVPPEVMERVRAALVRL
jgi:serine/threonine-protein kinase RsbW